MSDCECGRENGKSKRSERAEKQSVVQRGRRKARNKRPLKRDQKTKKKRKNGNIS